jgi:hypothetical protein
MNYASFSYNSDVGAAAMLVLLMVLALLTEFASFTIQMAQSLLLDTHKVYNTQTDYLTDVLKISFRNEHVTCS